MAVMAALAACGGGGKKAAVKSPANATNDSTSTSAVAGTNSAPATASGAPSTTTPKAGSSAATVKPGAAASGVSGGSGTGGSSGSGSSGAAGSNGSVGNSPSMTAVPAGHYHYTITGTSSAGSVPPGSDLTVDAPQGTSQHSRTTTQSQNGGGSTSDTTLDKQSDGAHLVDLTTVNNTPFGPVTIAFHPSPPPRIQPQPLAVGSTVGPFDMTSTDGKTIATVKVTIQAVN